LVALGNSELLFRASVRRPPISSSAIGRANFDVVRIARMDLANQARLRVFKVKVNFVSSSRLTEILIIVLWRLTFEIGLFRRVRVGVRPIRKPTSRQGNWFAQVPCLLELISYSRLCGI
jgi:hypothetical protein